MLESTLPVFSSQSFIVSGLTFRSLIHIEFVFVYGVRKCSSFIPMKPSFLITTYGRGLPYFRISYFLCILAPPLSKMKCPQGLGFIPGLSLAPLVWVPVPVSMPAFLTSTFVV